MEDNRENNILSSVSKLSLRKGDTIIIYQDENIDSLATLLASHAKTHSFKEKEISVWILPTSSRVEKFSRKELIKYKLHFECDCGKSLWFKLKRKLQLC